MRKTLSRARSAIHRQAPVAVAAIRHIAVLCAALSVADAAHADAPSSTAGAAPLACLARYYSITPVLEDGRWYARLPDAALIPWDDGKSKTMEQRLAAPDVKDVYAQRYRPGPIVPVSDEDFDPGRVRVDAIMSATWDKRGRGAATVDFFGSPLRVHTKIAPALSRVIERLKTAARRDPSLLPFFRHAGGTLSERNIAGTNRPSMHSYGVALDISTDLTEYWRWQKRGPLKWRNRTPQAIVDAFEAEGFIWGGRWFHYDTMHFEYRPELLDDACYPPR